MRIGSGGRRALAALAAILVSIPTIAGVLALLAFAIGVTLYGF